MYPFKVYNAMIFTIFIKFCYHHHIFMTPKNKKACMHYQSFLILSFLSLSISVYLPLLWISHT